MKVGERRIRQPKAPAVPFTDLPVSVLTVKAFSRRDFCINKLCH